MRYLIIFFFILYSNETAYSKALDVKQKSDDYIIIESSNLWGFGTKSEPVKKEYYNIAKKHCNSKKKNTYFFRTDSAYTKLKLHIRFFCASSYESALSLLENSLNNNYQEFPSYMKDYNLRRCYVWERDLSYEYIKMNEEKLKTEEDKKRKLELLKQAELRKKTEEEKKEKLVKLENEYGSKCSGILSLFKYEKGTPDYEKCLFSESAKDFERKELARKEKERIEKQQKEQILIAQQKEIVKISKFTPEEKRAYDCEKTFGFKKGSGDFKDCIFKLYTISAELEKEELRVQIKKLEMANERQKQIIAQNKVNQQVYVNENANQNAIADAMREANSIARGKALLEYSRTLNNRNRGTNCMITRHGIHSILNCR